jgi:hypothetical protein
MPQKKESPQPPPDKPKLPENRLVTGTNKFQKPFAKG